MAFVLYFIFFFLICYGFLFKHVSSIDLKKIKNNLLKSLCIHYKKMLILFYLILTYVHLLYLLINKIEIMSVITGKSILAIPCYVKYKKLRYRKLPNAIPHANR